MRAPRLLIPLALLALLAVPVAAAVRPGPSRHARPVEAVVRDWQRAQDVPAVSVAWAGPDGQVHTAAAGEAVLGAEPMRPAHRVHVGSVTKFAVASAVLRLAEQGALGLDDPLGRWLDEPARFRHVTVRQLLGHTAGVPGYTEGTDLFVRLDRRWTTDELLKLIERQEPSFPAGTGFRYSNTGYLLLGRIVEAATGRPYGEAIRTLVTEPLGMRDTGVSVQPTAAGYADIDFDGTPEDVREHIDVRGITGAAGELVSTPADLVRLAHGVLGGGLLRPETRALMTAWNPFNDGYGLGVQRLLPTLGEPMLGHGGAVPGYLSMLWWLPERELAVAVSVTTSARGAPADIAELVVRALDAQAQPTQS